MRQRVLPIAAAALLMGSNAGLPAHAQEGSGQQPATTTQGTAPAARPKPCTSPEHRQFDFWVGNWEVKDQQDGSMAGTNRIEKILGGCVIQENWAGTSGMVGTSFSMYDAAGKRWHQTWVDTNGLLLLLDGEFKDGKMTLAGDMASQGDLAKKVRHEVTWEQVGSGQVRQLWRSSADGGKTWSVVFDGLYSRRG